MGDVLPRDPARARWEWSWLRLVVRAEHDAATCAQATRLARGGGAWTRLLDRFEREALVARAAALLARLRPGSVPVDALDDLRTRRHLHHATGLVYHEMLRLLLERLQGAGVRALAFKGPVLGQAAYGDWTQRGYGDLDVLVPPAQRFRAAAVLAELGYQASQPVAPPHASPARHHTSVAFVGSGLVDVDLHWGFSTPLVPFDLPRTGLWRRTRTIELGGMRVDTLGSADTLLHTCFRGAKDDYVYWTALSDLGALLRRERDLDWPLVEALADRTGARRMLHLGLLLAADLAAAPLPQEVERTARADRGARTLAAAVRQRLQRGVATSQGIRSRLSRAWSLRERRADRVNAFLNALTRASEPRADESWPAWTWAVRRPLRLLRDLGRDERPSLGGTH